MMRRWLKRGFWLSAWGVWVWLGFGLHRELPKDLGPLVCQIPFEKKYSIVGFVGDTNRLAFQLYSPPHTMTITLFDAETGKRIATPNLEGRRDFIDDFRGCIQRGLLFLSDEWNPEENERVAGIQCIDLTTGERRRLTRRSAVHASLHDRFPWLAVSELATEGESEIRRVVVVDVETGRELFSKVPEPGRVIERRSFFLPETDKLVIPIGVPFGDESHGERGLEIWRIGESSVMEKFVEGMILHRKFSASTNGRIAQPARDLSQPVVFDLNEERVVFSLTDVRDGALRGADARNLRISRSGKSLLVGDPGLLWDIDSGRVVWSVGPNEDAVADVFPGSFITNENWSAFVPRGLSSDRYSATSFRDMETGRLIVRMKGFCGNLFPNRAGTLVANTTGEVHRLPHQVDWKLLALCQTILALPLILLWSLLYFFRRYRLRRTLERPNTV